MARMVTDRGEDYPGQMLIEQNAVRCCEHNPCPSRPMPRRKWVNVLWRCPACGRLWYSARVATPGGVNWIWQEYEGVSTDGR